jgi:hypothetical protein
MLKVHQSIVQHLGFGVIFLALHLYIQVKNITETNQNFVGVIILISPGIRTLTNVGVKHKAATPIQIYQDQTY